MRKTSVREFEAVLRLDGPQRFEHLVKRIVDEATAWGLWADNWLLVPDSSYKLAFPLWPAPEYARLLAKGDNGFLEPKELSLDELLDHLLPRFLQDSTRIAVFPTPKDGGLFVSAREMELAVRNEMMKYDWDY